MNEAELRQSIVDYGKRLVEVGLVQGTWGNLSVRLDEGHMLVTPSGLDYARLTADDVVKVDLSTLAYEGGRKPTSEKKLHQAVYLARPDVQAIVHTHSSACSVYAAARASIPDTTQAMHTLVGGTADCAGHALPSTSALSKKTLRALGQKNACLLAGHGVVCCGKDLETAFATAQALEDAAAAVLNAD